MMTDLRNTYVRMTVLVVVGIAMLSTGVGCREATLTTAARTATQSTRWASPEYVAGLSSPGYASNGAPLYGNTAQDVDNPTTSSGCSRYPCTTPPSCSGPSCSTEPVTPSWAGTSMGW